MSGQEDDLMAKLDALDAKRTKGPWRALYDNEAGPGWDWFIVLHGRENITGLSQADAAFIAGLENAWPQLRTALTTARERVKELEGALAPKAKSRKRK